MRGLSKEHSIRRRRRKLLLVEDDSSVLASMRMFLDSDYEIHSASTVRSGITLFKSVHPSLVVLDLRLDDGDGLEALRQIRNISRTAPVIVLTGYASMKTVEESLRLGASDYLHKPFDGFALKSRIDELASASPSKRARDKAAPATAKAEEQLCELEYRANASAMFLHDAAGAVMAALNSAQLICQSMEQTPERFDPETLEIGDQLYEAMGFISGLFEQSRSIEHLSQLDAAEVSIHKIVNLAVGMVQSKAKARNVSLAVHQKRKDAKVCANQYALIRVLLNLIRNAVEAVEPETGKVSVSVVVLDKEVEFIVQDNGPGIPEPLIEEVFDARFTTKEEGIGLGLYICKHLVETMNGELTVRSKQGQGCRFSVKIPSCL